VAWSGLEWLGVVLEGVRGCWSGVRAAWNMLECVGMVLEWNGVLPAQWKTTGTHIPAQTYFCFTPLCSMLFSLRRQGFFITRVML
jgi:hypothetical protein